MAEQKKQNKTDTKMINKKSGKKKDQMTNKERAEFYDMGQIEWYPIDPYCD